MVTDYKSILDQLRQEEMKALDEYYEAEKKLYDEGGGFTDNTYFEVVYPKYKEWQEVHNKFYDLLSFLKTKGMLSDILGK